MPRDAVSRTANVERTGRHKWVNGPGIPALLTAPPLSVFFEGRRFIYINTVYLLYKIYNKYIVYL